jgi:hypothetical protein
MTDLTRNELLEWLLFVKEHNPKFDCNVESVLELIGVFCRDIGLLEELVLLIKEKKFDEAVSFIFHNDSSIYRKIPDNI